MYRIEGNGVKHLPTNSWVPNDPGNSDWKEYEAWLRQGNTPDPELPRPVRTIDDEYNALSDWIKELIGPDATGFKAKILARRGL